MRRKPKFKPVITRIKLNPEQAVLSCSCYSTGRRYESWTLKTFGGAGLLCSDARLLNAIESPCGESGLNAPFFAASGTSGITSS